MGMESENPYEAPSGTRPRDSHHTIRVLGMWLIVAGVSLVACSVAVVMLTSVMLETGVVLQRIRFVSVEYGAPTGGCALLLGVAFWLNGRSTQ